jgi:glycerophosphoryl diester phosphodiesterase
MKIIGHRGIMSFSPENSLSGLNYIKSLKLNWVECDVILSKDNIPVIFHDKKLDRVTNFKGEVKNYKYKELEHVDIGYKYSLNFTGERIPSLFEYIKKCSELSINVFLELKKYYNDELTLVNNVMYNIKYFDNIKIILCSYSKTIISLINQLYPDIKKSIIVDKIPNDWYDFVKTNNCYSINVAYDKFDENDLSEIKKCCSKIPTYCFTVNDYEDYNNLKEIGVKGIITDKAEYFTTY